MDVSLSLLSATKEKRRKRGYNSHPQIMDSYFSPVHFLSHHGQGLRKRGNVQGLNLWARLYVLTVSPFPGVHMGISEHAMG